MVRETKGIRDESFFLFNEVLKKKALISRKWGIWFATLSKPANLKTPATLGLVGHSFDLPTNYSIFLSVIRLAEEQGAGLQPWAHFLQANHGDVNRQSCPSCFHYTCFHPGISTWHTELTRECPGLSGCLTMFPLEVARKNKVLSFKIMWFYLLLTNRNFVDKHQILASISQQKLSTDKFLDEAFSLPSP